MKRIHLILFLLLGGVFVHSQIFNPVSWSTRVERISEYEFDLIATAEIDADWHLYSQTVEENGPIPTTFIYFGSKKYLKKGNTKEETGIELYDKIFNMKIKYFVNGASFRQRIKVKNENSFTINAIVEFMVCNEVQCLPPNEEELTFNISK